MNRKTATSLGVIFAMILVSTTIIGVTITSVRLQIQSASAFTYPDTANRAQKASVVVSGGNNVYVVYSTDKGTANKNGEIMFQVSRDGGKTFSNKSI